MKRSPRRKKPKVEVRPASLADVQDFYDLRYRHWIANVDGVSVAMATLVRMNGRLWGFLDRRDGLSPSHGLVVIWALIKGLRTVGEPVYVASNEGIHPRANDLLRIVGFRTTGEISNGFKIWVYGNG